MDYYKVNAVLYGLLSKVVNDTQSILIDDIPRNSITPYPRLEESKFIISEDILRNTMTVVTAHDLTEYRPNQLKIETLMREKHRLLIDELLDALKGVRGVQIKRY